MGLDISLLETFLLVADLESFSEAARRQGLTQPAVSFQIKALEKELGATLIDRSHGKVVLTPAGRTAYRHASNIISGRDAMMADIPRATGEVAGRLLMGASTIPGEFLLPGMISKFRGMFPRVSISLDIKHSSGVLTDLREEKIELGFVGAGVEDSDLIQEHFAADTLVLITPPHHGLATRHSVSCEAFLGEPFVGRTAGSGTMSVVGTVLTGHGVSPGNLDVVAELGSTQSVINAVQSGMGVSIVSSRAAEHPARNGLVAVLEIEDVDLTRSFYTVRVKDRPLSVAAGKFLDLCTR